MVDHPLGADRTEHLGPHACEWARLRACPSAPNLHFLGGPLGLHDNFRFALRLPELDQYAPFARQTMDTTLGHGGHGLVDGQHRVGYSLV